MNKKILRPLLSAFAILIGIVACALPGQAIQPAPVITPGARETSIAGTLQAALEGTAAAQSSTTETSAEMTGTTLDQAQDGTTKYTDHDGGFQVTFPTGWLPVRPNSEEFEAALAKEGAVNSMLHDQMTHDQTTYDANFDRLFGYVLRPDLKKNVLFGFSTLAWNPEDAQPIDNAQMGKLVRDLESSGDIPGFHVTTAQLYDASSMPMMEIGGRFTIPDGQGGVLPFYSTIIFFKPSVQSTVRFTFAFLEDYHLQIYSDVKSIIDSIRLTEP